jgi:hypothetical protein
MDLGFEGGEQMADETLLSAARRVVRFFNIDNTSGGGLISIETEKAIGTLDIEISKANRKLEKIAEEFKSVGLRVIDP